MEVKDDLLKEVIADARAVRETALENAKIALEEAFNPHVKAMLAKQIQSEVEGEDEEEEFEDEMEDEEGADDIAVEPEVGEDEAEDDDEELEFEEGAEVSEEDEGEFEGEDEFEAEEEEEDELDLEATIKELEADLEGDDDEDMDYDDEVEEGTEEDDEELEFDVEDDEEEIDENDVSSEIGKSDNKQPGKANSTSGIGTVGKAKLKEDEELDEENVDLQELINQLLGEEEEMEDEEEESEIAIENAQLKADLEEHIKVVKFLRDKINEVNLLNSKLLYTNKLFRSFELDNEKKYKVVETFDRAKNLREVKLIFSTIAESFGAKSSKKIVETKIRKPKGASSKPVQSTKPQTDILEENVDLKARYQKLANIKK